MHSMAIAKNGILLYDHEITMSVFIKRFISDFLGADLEGANFSNTSLKKAIFEGANLTNVNFSESNLDLEDLETQEGVKLCGVVSPDGSTSDRDCE